MTITLFGDGSDGDIIIFEDTILTTDKNYNNLTINTGITLYPNGYIIYVKNTLINDGIINRNGINGVNGTRGSYPGIGGTGGIGLPSQSVGGSGAGGNGGTGSTGNGASPISGSNGTSVSGISWSTGGNGGNTRTDVGLVGGTGGITNNKHDVYCDILNDIILNVLNRLGGPGGGGGAGGFDTMYYDSAGGGGGGSGGGVTYISSKIIINNGTITANGGKGGDGFSAVTGSGAGGGGGGGFIVIEYETITNNGTITTTGGIAGLYCGGPICTYATNGIEGRVIYCKIPCIPDWQCELPLNGYASDGCGNRQPTPICNPSMEEDTLGLAIIAGVFSALVLYILYNETKEEKEIFKYKKK